MIRRDNLLRDGDIDATLRSESPQVRSYLAVPVISRRAGLMLGGLVFGHSKAAAFTPRSERLMVGIAAQAAVAIDNARLYDAAQKAALDRDVLLGAHRSRAHERIKR